MTPIRWLIGEAFSLPESLKERFPELADAHWRRGGIALRIGGWCIGRATVSGITMWRTIFLAPGAPLSLNCSCTNSGTFISLKQTHSFRCGMFGVA